MSDVVVSGLGLSELSVEGGATVTALAGTSIARAVADAGIGMGDVDGLLVNATQGDRPDRMDLFLGRRIGLGGLHHLAVLDAKGSTALAMVAAARDTIDRGEAAHVVCVFADAPIAPGGRAGAAFTSSGGTIGTRGLERASGLLGSVATFALLADRYLHVHGLTDEALCAVTCTTRQWALGNPTAIIRDPLDEDGYRASRLVAEPLRVVDCARPVNGSAAVVVSRADAVDLGRAVMMRSYAEWTEVRRRRTGGESWFGSAGARSAADRALAAAGVSRDDLDVVELSDPFSIITLCLLEDFGFAPPGGAAKLVSSGATAPGGSLPVNTGGGQLAGYYLQGMTPLVEAVVQLRGLGAQRQVPEAETAFVGSVGGRLDHYSCLVLGRAP